MHKKRIVLCCALAERVRGVEAQQLLLLMRRKSGRAVNLQSSVEMFGGRNTEGEKLVVGKFYAPCNSIKTSSLSVFWGTAQYLVIVYCFWLYL